MQQTRRGAVVDFDEAAGHGLVRGDDGVEWWFHAVALADGSRTITVGAEVTFHVAPGLLGRWEAGSISRAG